MHMNIYQKKENEEKEIKLASVQVYHHVSAITLFLEVLFPLVFFSLPRLFASLCG